VILHDAQPLGVARATAADGTGQSLHDWKERKHLDASSVRSVMTPFDQSFLVYSFDNMAAILNFRSQYL